MKDVYFLHNLRLGGVSIWERVLITSREILKIPKNIGKPKHLFISDLFALLTSQKMAAEDAAGKKLSVIIFFFERGRYCSLRYFPPFVADGKLTSFGLRGGSV